MLTGTGVLVTFDNIFGVLTANHVTENIKRFGDFGIAEAYHDKRELSSFTIKRGAYNIIDVAKYNKDNPIEGHDLSFIILPEGVLSSLKARKSFYNLRYASKFIFSKRLDNSDGKWVAFGCINEKTENIGSNEKYKMITKFTIMGILTKLKKKFKKPFENKNF